MDSNLDTEVVKKRARVIAIQRSLLVIGAFLAVTGFVALLYMSVIGYLTRDLLVDCTVPGGECYQRGEEETAKIVTDISNETIEGAIPLHQMTRWYIRQTVACADEPGVQTMPEIEKCVMDALAELEKEDKP